MRKVKTVSRGDDMVELEADALRQGHGFFGPDVPLRVVRDYEAEPSGISEQPKWWAHVIVTCDREPFAQSELAEDVRRQFQWVRRHAGEHVRSWLP